MALYRLLSLSIVLGAMAAQSLAAENVDFNSTSKQGLNSTHVMVPVVKGAEAPAVYFSEDAQKKTFATGASANAITDKSAPAVVLDESSSGGRDLAITACARGGDYSDQCLKAVLNSKFIDMVPSFACTMVDESYLRFQCYKVIVDKKYVAKDVQACMDYSFGYLVKCLAEHGRPIVTVTELQELKNQEIQIVSGIVFVRKASEMNGQTGDARVSTNNQDKSLRNESKPNSSPASPRKLSAGPRAD